MLFFFCIGSIFRMIFIKSRFVFFAFFLVGIGSCSQNPNIQEIYTFEVKDNFSLHFDETPIQTITEKFS